MGCLFGCNIYAACRWRYSTERPLHLNPASCHQDVSLFHWNARVLPKELKKHFPEKAWEGHERDGQEQYVFSFQTHKGYSKRPQVDTPQLPQSLERESLWLPRLSSPHQACSFQLESQRGVYIYRGFSSLNLFGDRGKWNWIVLLVGISNSQIWIFVLPFSHIKKSAKNSL